MNKFNNSKFAVSFCCFEIDSEWRVKTIFYQENEHFSCKSLYERRKCLGRVHPRGNEKKMLESTTLISRVHLFERKRFFRVACSFSSVLMLKVNFSSIFITIIYLARKHRMKNFPCKLLFICYFFYVWYCCCKELHSMVVQLYFLE